jgi:hypothetical protein
MKRILNLLIFGQIFIYSCGNSGSTNTNLKNTQVELKGSLIQDSIKFETDIRNKILTQSKLYLEFWINMSEKEYKYVCNKIENENILIKNSDNYYLQMTFENVEQVYYNPYSKKFTKDIVPVVIVDFILSPFFRNDSLYAIGLRDLAREMGKLESIKIGSSVYLLSGPSFVSKVSEKKILGLYIKKYGDPYNESKNDFKKTGMIGDFKDFIWILKDKVIEMHVISESFSYIKDLSERQYIDIMDITTMISITYKDKHTYNKEIESIRLKEQKTRENIKSTKNRI